MRLVASVYWSVCLSALSISATQRSILGARLCRVQQRAKKIHNQSMAFLSVCQIIAQMRSISFQCIILLLSLRIYRVTCTFKISENELH